MVVTRREEGGEVSKNPPSTGPGWTHNRMLRKWALDPLLLLLCAVLRLKLTLRLICRSFFFVCGYEGYKQYWFVTSRAESTAKESIVVTRHMSIKSPSASSDPSLDKKVTCYGLSSSTRKGGGKLRIIEGFCVPEITLWTTTWWKIAA